MTILGDIRSLAGDTLLALSPSDDMASWPRGSCLWLTGDNQEKTIGVPIAEDADFVASGMNIFLGARLRDGANPRTTATELTYRPATWVSTNNTTFESDPGNLKVQDANASFLLTDDFNGSYERNGTPIPVGLTLSSRYGQGTVFSESIASAWVGRLDFFAGRTFRRGSSVSVTIYPTFSRVLNAIIKTEFRATVVFTGKKKLRRSL